MKAANLQTFEAVYTRDADPWRTFESRDELIKRRAILRHLGQGRRGRLLELGAGAGANSICLSSRALSLDATDGAAASVRLIAEALRENPRACAIHLALPARPPRPQYDAIVIAELLYYLQPRAMRLVAKMVRQALHPGARLVLAHHRIDFHDFAQKAGGIHDRFLSATGGAWRRAQQTQRTRRWIVESYELRQTSGKPTRQGENSDTIVRCGEPIQR